MIYISGVSFHRIMYHVAVTLSG